MAVIHRIPGLVVTEHEFRVPLDHARPEGDQLTVFAREVADPDGLDKPFLVFLQGGPGFEAPRPTGDPKAPGWVDRALRDFRVLLLDQRGTGRSTAVGPLRDMTPAQQAAYLAHFRADAIVADAEWIRNALDVERWSVLGQSFGGFVALAYLSFAPDGLSSVMVAGGLPPLDRPPEDVYRATFARVHQRYEQLVHRYPDDGHRLDAVADHITACDVRLPAGDRLTVARLRSLGMGLGYRDGLERVHYLLEGAWTSSARDELADDFLAAVETATSFVERPLYALLHESIYCQGFASRWAAQRVMDTLPEFQPTARPLLPTGEMVLPDLIRGDRAVAPLADTADILAAHDGWPALYDLDVLAANEVPVAAVVYHEDMYVEHAFSLETAARVGALRTWTTSALGHDGLRSDDRVLDRLLAMTRMGS
jgi:pimeloyl-ACP methyl ester carboxylesterase